LFVKSFLQTASGTLDARSNPSHPDPLLRNLGAILGDSAAAPLGTFFLEGILAIATENATPPPKGAALELFRDLTFDLNQLSSPTLTKTYQTGTGVPLKFVEAGTTSPLGGSFATSLGLLSPDDTTTAFVGPNQNTIINDPVTVTVRVVPVHRLDQVSGTVKLFKATPGGRVLVGVRPLALPGGSPTGGEAAFVFPSPAIPATPVGALPTLPLGTTVFSAEFVTQYAADPFNVDLFIASSTTADHTVTVGGTGTSTTLTAPTSVLSGSAVSLSAAVVQAVGAVVPTGTIDFFNTTTGLSIGSAALNASGVATVNYTPPAGSDPLTLRADYSPTGVFVASQSLVSTVEVIDVLTITLAAPAAPTAYPNAPTVGVTVASTFRVPKGVIRVFDGATQITSAVVDPAVLTSTSVSVATSALSVGANANVTATFSPDAPSLVAAVTSAAVSIPVAKGASITTLTILPAAPTDGGTLTLSVSVAGAGVVPSGSVQIVRIGSSVLSVSLAGGVGSVVIPANVGTQNFTANYLGDSNYNASSTTGSVVVSPTTTTTVLGISAPPLAPTTTTTTTTTSTTIALVPTGSIVQRLVFPPIEQLSPNTTTTTATTTTTTTTPIGRPQTASAPVSPSSQLLKPSASLLASSSVTSTPSSAPATPDADIAQPSKRAKKPGVAPSATVTSTAKFPGSNSLKALPRAATQFLVVPEKPLVISTTSAPSSATENTEAQFPSTSTASPSALPPVVEGVESSERVGLPSESSNAAQAGALADVNKASTSDSSAPEPVPASSDNKPNSDNPDAAKEPGSGSNTGTKTKPMALNVKPALMPVDPQDPRGKVDSIFPVPGPYYATDMGGTLGSGQIERPLMIRSIAAPSEISFDAALLARNSLLALLLMLLVALPAELFNATFRTHHDEVIRHVGMVQKRLRPVQSFLDRLPNGIGLVFFAGLAGALWAFVDPSFGWNKTSLALIVGLTAAIASVTFISALTKNAYLKRSYGIAGRLRILPSGVLLAVSLLLISRLAKFNPGYLFGVFASLSFAKEPTGKQSGKAVAQSALWMVLVAVASWFIWVPVKHLAVEGTGGLGVLVLDAFLSNLWVWSLQALVFSLIPLDLLDGRDVVAWSRKAWVALYGSVMFVFVHMVLHPNTVRYGSNPNANIVTMSYLFVGFMTIAVLFWAYFQIVGRRHRTGGREHQVHQELQAHQELQEHQESRVVS
jgi:Bacterial Ig-like domain (group 3)